MNTRPNNPAPSLQSPLQKQDEFKEYDFVFLGAGCAALSIVMRMIRSGKFNDKKILLIDKSNKKNNDRTWCFWEKDRGFFDDIVHKKWDHLSFYSKSSGRELNIFPYQYKMIRSIDLYEHCFQEISEHYNIEFIQSEARTYYDRYDGFIIELGDRRIFSGDRTKMFNSIYQETHERKDAIYLLQHFKGWLIECDNDHFDPARATLMDFRVDQHRGTTFGYVLPLTSRKALVEYTLFTDKVLGQDEYDVELKNYLSEILGIKNYKVIDQEFGVIPMTNEKFLFYDKNGIFNIGSAGGQTKASSGYTFQFIQKQADSIVDCLLNGKELAWIRNDPGRFRFYDSVLLRILKNNSYPGHEIFTRMFLRNPADRILRFLDNESTFKEELKLITSLPTIPFLKSALKQVFS